MAAREWPPSSYQSSSGRVGAVPMSSSQIPAIANSRSVRESPAGGAPSLPRVWFESAAVRGEGSGEAGMLMGMAGLRPAFGGVGLPDRARLLRLIDARASPARLQSSPAGGRKRPIGARGFVRAD